MIDFLVNNMISVGAFLVVGAVIMFLVSFWHLNFKHLNKTTIGVISSAISLALIFTYVPLVERIIVDFQNEIVIIHTLLMVVFFVLAILFSCFVKRSIPSVFQIIGPVLFCAGYFLLLA